MVHTVQALATVPVVIIKKRVGVGVHVQVRAESSSRAVSRAAWPCLTRSHTHTPALQTRHQSSSDTQDAQPPSR